MTCETVRIGDASAIVCHRRRRERPRWCCICGRQASRLCDFKRMGGAGCDKSLCTECAVHGGPGVDYCPTHPGAAPQLDLFG